MPWPAGSLASSARRRLAANSRIIRRLLVLLLSLAAPLLAALPAVAERVDGLYQAVAIVTGQENEAERQRGMREALTEVLVKVSGDSRLASDPRLPPLLERAGDFVRAFSYEDRLARKKLMDEQGTRERSYNLKVDFDPEAIDRALGGLGRRPWPADRPRVLVLLLIHDTVGSYLLEAESSRGYGHREALLSIARRRGLPVALPRTDPSEPGSALIERVGEGDAPTLRRLRTAAGADRVLLGTMAITADGAWQTQWTLAQDEGERRWSVGPTTFDQAIAEGIDGSIRRLAAIG